MNTIKRLGATALVSGLTLLGVVASGAPAAAQPFERDHFHEVTTEVFEDFCGDLTVRVVDDTRGSFLLNAHGPDGLAYAIANLHRTVSYTNLANGKTFTEAFNFLERDLRVTDNGDGTLTILVLVTGAHKVYGPDGQVLFLDNGPIWFEVLIGDNGTPTDPSDDEFLEFLGVVKRVGRNDLEGRDFCDDIHEFIG